MARHAAGWGRLCAAAGRSRVCVCRACRFSDLAKRKRRCDMTSMRQVTSAQGEQLARECAPPPPACSAHTCEALPTLTAPPRTLPRPDDMKFFETSARSGQNVTEAFITLATDVKERLLKAGGEPQTGGVNLGQAQKAPGKKGCC